MIPRWIIFLVDDVGRRLKIDGRYFIRSGFWSLFSDGVLLAAGLAVATVFARIATKEDFGQFQLMLSVVGLIAVVSVKGFEAVVVRDVSRGLYGVYRRVVRRRFWWSWLATPVLLVFASYYWWQGTIAVAWGLGLAALLAPAHYTTQLWPSFYKGISEFGTLARLTTLRAGITSIVVLAAILLFRGNPLIAFGTYFITQLLINFIVVRYSLAHLSNDATSDDWLSFGHFITKTGIFKTTAANIDSVLVGVLISPAALAVYSIALVIPKYALLVVKSLFQTTLPRLSGKKTLSFHELGVTFAIGILGTLVTIVGCRLIIVPLFGAEYAEAVPLAYIASLAMVFHPLAQLLSNFSQMTTNRRVVLATNTANPIIRILLLVVLGVFWKTPGVAVAYSLASLSWVVISLLVMRVDIRRRFVA